MFLDLVKGFICVGLFSVDLTWVKLCSFLSLFPYIWLMYETVMQNFMQLLLHKEIPTEHPSWP